MKTLDRKLLRDLWSIRAQALTIALVIASGIGGFVGSLSTHDSLNEARSRYYAAARFADVFSYAKRVPDPVAARLAELPGVAEVDARVVQDAQIDLPGVAQPLSGRLIGADLAQLRQGLNRLDLRAGAWPAPGSHEVLVSEAFARARGLRPGATLHALLNGRRTRLVVTGIALSPEYVYAAATAGLADDRSFGVFWIDRERLAAAFDMTGTFNSVAIKLRPGASPGAVIEEVDRRLAVYGSRGAFGRDEHPSNRMLTQEIREQRTFGVVLPTVFLLVALFVLNVVLGRQVTTQRDQIASLKALGYENRQIVGHYLKLALLIAAGGILLGIGIGQWFGRYMTGMYTEFFRFPTFYHRTAPWIVLAGSVAFLAAAAAGAWQAVRALVALPAAEAMRPPSPAVYRPLLVERLPAGRRVGPRAKMIIRTLKRRPGRAALTTLGIASAVAILIGGTWWRDALDYLLDVQFNAVYAGDLYVGLVEPAGSAARHEFARLPGVLRAETSRSVPVRLRAAHLSHRTTLQSVAPDAQLRRLIDLDLRPVPLRAGGLLLTDRLADILEVRPGDRVRIEFLEGERREREVEVTGLVREMMGVSAYVDPETLARLSGEAELANSGALRIDAGQRDALFAELKRLPRVAGVFVKSAMLDYTRATMARNILIFTTVLTLFAAAIAVGVVYNSARIALAERSWELATLRVLGFTHRDVTVLLLGELALETAVAIPLGFVGGYYLSGLLVQMMSSEFVTIPLVIAPRTYAYAGLMMLAAGLVSAWIVQHRLSHADLIAVLKTRE